MGHRRWRHHLQVDFRIRLTHAFSRRHTSNPNPSTRSSGAAHSVRPTPVSERAGLAAVERRGRIGCAASAFGSRDHKGCGFPPGVSPRHHINSRPESVIRKTPLRVCNADRLVITVVQTRPARQSLRPVPPACILSPREIRINRAAHGWLLRKCNAANRTCQVVVNVVRNEIVRSIVSMAWSSQSRLGFLRAADRVL